MCMLAHSVPARLTRTDPHPTFRKRVVEPISRCVGELPGTEGCRESQRPLLSWPGSITMGGEGPGGSRKLAALFKPTADLRWSEEGLQLLAIQTSSLQGAGFPPSSWLSACFAVVNKPEMKRIYNKTPASHSIRWSCSREGAEQWCSSCP